LFSPILDEVNQMPRNKKSDQKPIEQYNHKGKKRVNNPPVGLVTPETDRETGKKKYAYDPHLDPQAAKDIDELDPLKTGMTFLKVQMNADLLTDDLKKKRTSNESFWLIGQPDIRLHVIARNPPKADDKAISKKKKGIASPPAADRNDTSVQYQVEVLGFDYYNTRTGTIESGGTDKIALWMLDTDYDGCSLFPKQVFFPMAGEKEGWSKLARNLKAEIDEELIEAYRGTVSLPFGPGKNKRIAIKIVDDRGIESLKIMEVE